MGYLKGLCLDRYLYINDICEVSNALKFVLFADNTNILVSGENLQLSSIITLEISKLKKWFDNNKLIMVFGNCHKDDQIQVQIEGVTLEMVNDNKFLGVIINEKICWKPHIKDLENKLSKSISVMAEVKHILNNKSLHILYNSLVLLYLTSCSEVWGVNYKSSLQPLSLLQKRAITIIHYVSFYEHTNPLFLKSKILKFEDLVEINIFQIMFKAANELLPEHIQKMFFEREGGFNLRGQFNLRICSIHTTRKSFCI